MDLRHTERTGTVSDVEVIDGGKRATVSFDTDDESFDGLDSWKFAFSQLLKFADLRKGDLKDDEGEMLSNAGSIIVDALDDRELTFKYNKQRSRPLIAIVSPGYATLPSEEVENVVRETITSMGISDFEFREESSGRLIEEFTYVFEGDENAREIAEVGDELRAGITVKNSVFGACALKVNQFISILACSNGMVSRQSEAQFKRVHMGSPSDIREKLAEEVEMQVENIWDNTSFIQNVASIKLPIVEQLDFLSKMTENGKITKTSAEVMAGHIIHESGGSLDDYDEEEMELDFSLPGKLPEDDVTWNTGDEDAWGLLNAFTGYTTHSELSGRSTLQQMERRYNEILGAESKDEVLAVAE